MANGGYLYWDSRFLKDLPHLDGIDFSTPNETLPNNVKWEPQEREAVYVIPTKAKTHRVQQVALGTDAPIVRRSYNFEATLIANDEEEYFRILRAAERGAVVNWVPFVWLEEVINATSAATYQLSRPVAWGIASEANSTNHPAITYLADVVESTPAEHGSISGQTFTAASTGVIAVRYLPAFRVVVDGVSHAVPVTNGLEFSLTLREAISVG